MGKKPITIEGSSRRSIDKEIVREVTDIYVELPEESTDVYLRIISFVYAHPEVVTALQRLPRRVLLKMAKEPEILAASLIAAIGKTSPDIREYLAEQFLCLKWLRDEDEE